MPIYTRRGDKGTTGLYTPKGAETRVPKDDARVEAYGSVDELNAHLAHLACMVESPALREEIRHIQMVLFHVGYDLSTLGDPVPTKVTQEDVRFLEERIDAMTRSQPALRAFILPGGGPAAAYAHVCRTVCRRAERRAVSLGARVSVNPQAASYLNRLSDYLFTLARDLTEGEEVEVVWRT